MCRSRQPSWVLPVLGMLCAIGLPAISAVIALTMEPPALDQVTYSFAPKDTASYGVYELALAPGPPGVVWWREAPNAAWHQDLLILTAWGVLSIDNIIEDEQPGVYWLVGTDLTRTNRDSCTVWVRKDLGDGTPGHYGSNTKPYLRGTIPKIAKPKWHVN